MSIFRQLIIENSNGTTQFKPENELDNIEYKLSLDSKIDGTKNGIPLRRMESQMKWRMSVGKEITGIYQAHYVLGIDDDGNAGCLTDEELNRSYEIFLEVVKRSEAIVIFKEIIQLKVMINNKICDSNIICASIQKSNNKKIKEISIFMVGSTDVGKSTLMSFLTFGQFDDGNGDIRRYVSRYEHEKISGITSSVRREIVGIKKGKNFLINYSTGIQTSWENIVKNSDIIINLIDLPGSNKYSRTRYFGLANTRPEVIMLMIDINKFNKLSELSDDINQETKNNIIFYSNCARLVNAKLLIIFTKYDLMNNINKSEICDKIKCIINQDNIDILDKTNYNTDNILITFISTLDGYGIDLLINYFEKIAYIISDEKTINNDSDNTIFYLTDTIYIPDTGIVLSGHLDMGTLKTNQMVYITDGINYLKTNIKSIQKKQIDCTELYQNESGSIRLNIENSRQNINKHMIICSRQYPLYDSVCITIDYETNKKFEIGHEYLLFINNSIVCVIIREIREIREIEKKQILILKIKDTKIIIPQIDEILTYGIIRDNFGDGFIGIITKNKIII